MATKPSKKPRGIDALFAESNATETVDVKTKLRITEIQPRSNQPRKSFDSESLSKLADSIAANGLIQPIVVRESIGGYYEIIAGERRWRASKLAGLTEVPVVIINSDDKQTAEMSLIENVQREDLNPIEEAMAYKMLLNDFNMTQEEVATRVGKSRSAIANTIRLTELPDEVIDLVADRTLSEGHARTLLGLKNRESILGIAKTVVERELNVRQTEELVKKLNEKASEIEEQPEETASVKDVDYVAELEKKIRQTIGRRVKILEGKRTKKLEIEYTDNDDLENLLKILCGDSIFED